MGERIGYEKRVGKLVEKVSFEKRTEVNKGGYDKYRYKLLLLFVVCL